jgi:hypothetical protein
MSRHTLSLLVCALAAGCSGGSRSGGATTAAPVTSGSATAASTSSWSFTNASPAPTPLPPSFQLVGSDTLEAGSSSPRGVAQGDHEVHVATDTDWASFWPTHSGAVLPAVDFSQESVVGAFLGQISGTENWTRVIHVARDLNSDDLRARVRSFRRGPWRPVVRVLTSPFHLVRVDSAVSGQGALLVDRQTQLDFEVIAAGPNSALGAGDPTYPGGLRVIRDGADFNAFFAQIQPGVRPPAVDFQREMVVAVLGPYIARFGNSVQTLRLVHDANSDVIRVLSRVNPYRGGAAPPPATETPFQVLRVSLATGSIRAESTTPWTQTPLASGWSPRYRGAADTRLVRDAATFAGLWSARIGGATPFVDFSVDQVLMAFEAPGSGRTVSVARSVMLEDEELAVTVNARGGIGAVLPEAAYSVVTTPRTYGPVGFETIDTTPRP